MISVHVQYTHADGPDIGVRPHKKRFKVAKKYQAFVDMCCTFKG